MIENRRVLQEGESEPAGTPEPSDPPALDLAHLSRQCLGDQELETELLLLFRSQAVSLAAQLARSGDCPPAGQAALAHRLRGSALAIGAVRVARAAAVVEACGATGARSGAESSTQPATMSQAIATLSGAVADAVEEIDRLRSPG